MNKYISAGIVVYRLKEKKREYLILQYARGHWGFAKGKVEKNETLLQAAHRELLEEANISAKITIGFQHSFDYFFTDYDDKKAHKEVTFFVGRACVDSDKIVLSDEHSSYSWKSYKEVLEALTYQNAKDLLQKVERFLNK